MKIILDKELDLNETDYLNTKYYSQTLVEIVNSTVPNTPVTIGLFGEWGSGKSSIIQTAQKHLELNKKNKFIVYDAWKYSNDSFRRMFLLHVQRELNFEGSSLLNSFYVNENEDVKINKKFNIKYLSIVAVIVLLGLIIINTNKENYQSNLNITVIISTLSLLVSIFSKAFDETKITVQKPHLFAPEQFEECLNDMVSQAITKESKFQTVSRWFKGNTNISNLEKLIIVIDNIDRCSKEVAYELLSDIKNFTGSANNLIFLIPVDDEALKNHINNIRGKGKKNESEEFLRKLFNLVLRIKPFKSRELYGFTNDINNKNNLGFSNISIDLISSEYASNPRRIIQFMNNMSSEISLLKFKYGEEFAQQHEAVICKFLIIKEEWPEAFKLITYNPYLIEDRDAFTARYTEVVKETSDLSNFLLYSSAITNGISKDVIIKIISNNDNFGHLSQEILDLITNGDYNEIIEKTTDEVLYNEIIDYIIDELRVSIQRNLFETRVRFIFDLLLNINQIKKLSFAHNTKILGIIESHHDHIYSYLTHFDNLIEYSKDLSLNGKDQLKESIFRIINNKVQNNENSLNDKSTNETIISLIKSYILDGSSTKTLSRYFNKLYKSKARKPIKEYGFSQEILDKLLTDELITSNIERISGLEMDENLFIDDLFLITNYRDLPIELFNKILEKINAIYPDVDDFDNKAHSQVIKSLNIIIENLIKNDFITNNNSGLEKLCTMLLNPRTVEGVGVNAANEDLEDDEIEVLMDFVLNISIISNRTISKADLLEKLLTYSSIEKSIINQKFNSIFKRDKNFAFVFRKAISNIGLDEDNAEIFEYLLNRKNNNSYIINDDDATEIIKQTLDEILKNSTKGTSYKKLLSQTSKDERNNSIIIKLIMQFSSDDFDKLPSEIKIVAFNEICDETNFDRYKSNFLIIKFIFDNGASNHISYCIKHIVGLLLKKVHTSEVLNLILGLNIDKISKKDYELLISTIKSLVLEEYEEDMQTLIESSIAYLTERKK